MSFEQHIYPTGQPPGLPLVPGPPRDASRSYAAGATTRFHNLRCIRAPKRMKPAIDPVTIGLVASLAALMIAFGSSFAAPPERRCCMDPLCGWRPEPGRRRVVPFRALLQRLTLITDGRQRDRYWLRVSGVAGLGRARTIRRRRGIAALMRCLCNIMAQEPRFYHTGAARKRGAFDAVTTGGRMPRLRLAEVSQVDHRISQRFKSIM
jgi:hypothetical protein